MCLYVETIRIQNGRVRNIKYHNNRCNTTRREIFQENRPLNLRKVIIPPSSLGIYKCRILYSHKIEKVQYIPYVLSPIKTLRKINSDQIEYSYKRCNRKKLEDLYTQREDCDDILIIKDGKVTDTFYGNVALQFENQWYTPKSPLLPGTMRQYLLNKNVIKTKEIYHFDLEKYDNICVFNALIPFGKIIIKTEKIY